MTEPNDGKTPKLDAETPRSIAGDETLVGVRTCCGKRHKVNDPCPKERDHGNE